MSSLIGRTRLYWGLGSDPRPQTPDARPYLVNRLDRETSGVVLIAKNSATAGELGKSMEARLVHKEYLAIVHGQVWENHGLIDAPLGKDDRSLVAVKDCVRPDGSPARTEFFVEQRFTHRIPPAPIISVPTGSEEGSAVPSPAGAGEGGRRPDEGSREKLINALGEAQPPFSLLRIIPHTGRKHQIRIHLAHLGHPIVGDKLYGQDEDCYLALAQTRLTDAQRAKLIFNNHALHARSLSFDWRGRPMAFTCEPEPWFTSFVGDDVRRL